MTLSSRRISLTVIGLAAALALGGCGRKAGLDLPPGVSMQQEPAVVEEAPAAVAHGNVYESPTGNNNTPTAPRGQKKRIILDPILD